VKRRTVCRALAAPPVAVAVPASAQPAHPYRVAWVSIERAGRPSPGLEAFRGGMSELGYVVDKIRKGPIREIGPSSCRPRSSW